MKVFRTSLGGKPYQVLSPILPVRRLFVTTLGSGSWQIWGDKTGFERLAHLAMLATVSPNSIIYVPKSGDTVCFRQDHSLAHDLILIHHRMQLPPSGWKEIRSRLGKGRLATKSVPEPDPEAKQPIVYRDQPASEPVDIVQHSNTLFIVSSKPTLTFMAGEFQSLSSCEATGDHSHLFHLMRNGGCDERDDLTMAFAAAEDWKETTVPLTA